MRVGLIKFLVVPQSMRAVVTTVLVLYFRRIGKQMAHSSLLATSTEAMTKGEDVAATPCFKKMLCLSHQLPWLAVKGETTQWISFLSPLTLLRISQTPFQWW